MAWFNNLVDFMEDTNGCRGEDRGLAAVCAGWLVFVVIGTVLSIIGGLAALLGGGSFGISILACGGIIHSAGFVMLCLKCWHII